MLRAVLLVCQLLCISFCIYPAIGHAADNSWLADSSYGKSKYIVFAGYEWEVKEGRYHPGKNDWLANNVWVDKQGYLHLKVSRVGNRWYCAEVSSVKRFGYGSYQFQVIGAVDKLDPNIVLGLFVYPGRENFAEDNEIDIEFTKWGEPDAATGNYTVAAAAETYHFPFYLDGNYTSQQFTWTKNQILFQSFHGHVPSDDTQFSSWLYNSDEYLGKMPKPPVRVHMNLWLFLGKPPIDGQEREVVIKNFIFKPI